MKRLLIAIAFLSTSMFAFSQTAPDRFATLSNMQGKEIILYNAEAMNNTVGPFAYIQNNGKPAVVKDASLYRRMTENPVKIGSLTKVGNKEYLEASIDGKSYLLATGEGYNYTAGARSMSYWNEIINELNSKYNYSEVNSKFIKVNISPRDVLLGRYLKISWTHAAMQQGIKDPVQIAYTLADKTEGFCTLDEIMEHENDFITEEKFQTYRLTNADEASSERNTYEERSAITDNAKVIEAEIHNTYDNRSILQRAGVTITSGDSPLKLSVYGVLPGTTAKNNKYLGFVLGSQVQIPASGLTFTSDTDKDYIDERGKAGEDARKEIARLNDEQYHTDYIESRMKAEKRLKEKQEKTLAFYDKTQILILDQEFVKSDYRCGVKVKMFNCFKQEIKQIALRVVAFNEAGTTQKDDMGEFAKDIRCNGPISVHDSGVFEFERLFWDDGKHIKEIRLVEVKVTLNNGAVVTWAGKENVDKHKAGSYNLNNM